MRSGTERTDLRPCRPAGNLPGLTVHTAKPLLIAVLLLALAACEPVVIEERPTNDLFARLRGGGGGGSAGAPGRSQLPPGAVDAEPGPIRVTNPDGSVTLYARSGRDLMVHIQQTLLADERELFTEQVLSERTRAEYRQRGLDPAQAFDTLKRRQDDVLALFNRIGPFGEHSPLARMENVGRNVFRVRVTGLAAEDLSWTFFDMILEDRQWRLRWFGRQ